MLPGPRSHLIQDEMPETRDLVDLCEVLKTRVACFSSPPGFLRGPLRNAWRIAFDAVNAFGSLPRQQIWEGIASRMSALVAGPAWRPRLRLQTF